MLISFYKIGFGIALKENRLHMACKKYFLAFNTLRIAFSGNISFNYASAMKGSGGVNSSFHFLTIK